MIYDGETPEEFIQEIGSSQEPFALWFREKVKDLHGFGLAEAVGAPSELVNDFQTE